MLWPVGLLRSCAVMAAASESTRTYRSHEFFEGASWLYCDSGANAQRRVLWCAIAATAAGSAKTRNVIFVMTDGLRWQEVFNGAEAALMDKDRGGVANAADASKRDFWRDTPEAAARPSCPFCGAPWPSRARSSAIASGLRRLRHQRPQFLLPRLQRDPHRRADPRVKSNDKIPNPNVTVLEWLNEARLSRQGGGLRLLGRLPLHLQRAARRLPGNAGYDPLTVAAGHARASRCSTGSRPTPGSGTAKPTIPSCFTPRSNT